MVISLKLIIYNIIFRFKFLFKANKSEKIEIYEKDLISSKKNSSLFWSKAFHGIYDNLKSYDNFFFINYPYIYMTMVYSNKKNINIEKQEILKSKQFKIINSSVLKKNQFNIDIKNNSFGNIIHQIYNLNQLLTFIEKSSSKVIIKNVLEIGAGYGSLFKIMKILYPNIKYNIFDSIIMNKIQSYYIKKSNISILPNYVSEKSLSKYSDKKIDLFIALWSISEIPINNRKKFEKIIFNSKFSLIGFQNNFFEIDNKSYFEKLLSKNKVKNYKFINPKHYNNNSYLVIDL